MKRTEELSRGTLKKISPLRNKCDCGNKVTDHHWLCNTCWSLKEKLRLRSRSRELIMSEQKVLSKLTKEEKIEYLKKQGKIK